MLSVLHVVPHASTFLPRLPSARFCFPRFSTACDRVQYYAGSDSCRPLASSTGLAAYSALPTKHPAPNHVVCPDVAFPHHTRASDRVAPVRAMPFSVVSQASPSMSRLAALTPPNRIRHPTGCSFASGCSPPRLTTTQLPSATYVVTPHDTDFHHADKASSRPHSSPRKRGSSTPQRLRLLDPRFRGMTGERLASVLWFHFTGNGSSATIRPCSR